MIPELENCHLDHIAIAVKSINDSQKIYSDLGLVFDPKREVVTDQSVTTSFAQIDQLAHIELLEPFGESGPIHTFIEKKGPGLHHLCFRVKDIVAKETELLAKGYVLLYPKAKMGANSCMVNFIHPKSTGGVLIEISQKMGKV